MIWPFRRKPRTPSHPLPYRLNQLWATDFGEVELPEGGCPMKAIIETRYDEFDGEPHEVKSRVPDYSSPLGEKWRMYAKYIEVKAEAVWREGGDVYEMKVVPFSEWASGRGCPK